MPGENGRSILMRNLHMQHRMNGPGLDLLRLKSNIGKLHSAYLTGVVSTNQYEFNLFDWKFSS